jgi:hypothetical protein
VSSGAAIRSHWSSGDGNGQAGQASCFLDEELPRILTELDGLPGLMFLLSLKTGLREGEEAPSPRTM